MKLSKLSVWCITDGMTAAAAAALAQRVERWGYGALWIPEAVGRNALVHAGWLLANTSTLVVATGVARIHARNAVAMATAQLALAEQSGGRFLLGIGVSHAPIVEKQLGETYEKPVATMRAYVEAMGRAPYGSPAPADKPPLVLAALGPRMLALSAEVAQGAHSYNVTPEHTAIARRVMGPSAWLCVEQKVLLESDPAKARAIARGFVGGIGRTANYRASLLRLGFTAEDLDPQASDRVVDALVAWGSEKTIRDRIRAHFDAGATQVCVHAISEGGYASKGPEEKVLALLAPGA